MSNQIPQLVEAVTIETLLNDNTKKFESVLPKTLSVKKLFRLTVTEVRKNPALAKCTTESLIGALLQCAQVGLEIGTQKAYLVPYNKSINIGTTTNPNWIKHKECQFQISYRGLIELALRSAKVLKIYAQAVFSNQYFIIQYGTNEKLEHYPLKDKNNQPLLETNKGEFIGVFAIAKIATAKGDEYQFDFMDKDAIDTIKERAKAKSENTPWNTDYYEMAKKTVTKRLCKYLPSSAELEEALTMDDDSELDFNGNIYDHDQQMPKEKTKTEKMKQSLENQKAQNIINTAVKSSPQSNNNDLDKSWDDFKNEHETSTIPAPQQG